MNQNKAIAVRRNQNIRMLPNIFCLGYLMILSITALWQYINKLFSSSSRPGSASGRKVGGYYTSANAVIGINVNKTFW